MAIRPAVAGVAVATALLLIAFPGWASPADTNDDIIVNVRKDGPDVIVDVDCPVDAPWPIVWEVLTDFDHMAQFISTLDYSRVESRTANLLRVRQTGKASRGILSLSFDNVREVELVEHREVRSRMVSGDLEASAFVTRIVVEADATVRILNSGRYTSAYWVPPVIGPLLIEAGFRIQFGEIRAEILRRSAMIRTTP
jgi:hypothetical protein